GLIGVLKTQGVYEVYLPFLLTFAIFYGLLRRMGLFKTLTSDGKPDDSGNKISALIAFIAAMYVTIFSPAAIPISHFFATFFTQSSIALILLMVFAMVVSMFLWSPFFSQKKIFEFGKDAVPIILGVGGLIVLGMFVSSGGVKLFSNLIPPGVNISGEDVALIILVIATVIIISAVTREGPAPQKDYIHVVNA
ncbi:MAG: hypothetical protein N3D75_04535, partial [Candidatus Aenigmarchaeota archaeon]|nr:hypothetical protein [Candidatus Aenigmarchaeota archaeon]